MARIASIKKNDQRKKIVQLWQSKRSALSANINDKSLSLEERFAFVMQLARLPRNSAAVRVRNRCAITGRPRGFYRKLGVSRNVLRDLAAHGMLPGVIKSSW